MRGGNKEGRESGREGGEERMGLAGLEMGIFGKVETGDPVFEIIVWFLWRFVFSWDRDGFMVSDVWVNVLEG